MALVRKPIGAITRELQIPKSQLNEIPKTIWTFWRQGLENAPQVVQKCIESWIERNPGWNVVVLDESYLSNSVGNILNDEIRSHISPNHFSDLLRLFLLSQRGGVWVDATVYCVLPLDEWLAGNCDQGFFAFHGPGKDRLVASWFLASQKKGPLVSEFFRRFRDFWMEHQFGPLSPQQFRQMRFFTKLFGQATWTTRFWFHPFITKKLKIYPYFIFHYTFERVVATHQESRRIWRSCPKISANGPLLIDKLGFFSRADSASLAKIQNSRSPMFKLSWKIDQEKYRPGTLLYTMLEEL